MNDGQLHQVSAEIGALKKSVELMTDLWKTQETSASAGRRALHDRFETFKDEIGLQIAGLSLRVDRLADKLTNIDPMIDAARNSREEELRQEGARRLGFRLWSAIVAAAGVAGWGLHELISYLRHP